MGLEYCKWSDRDDRAARRDDPVHPDADRTDGLHAGRLPQRDAGRVRRQRNELPVVMTTRAHQLAHVRRLRQPAADALRHARRLPRRSPGAEFLKVVPATWDETRVLDGKIGEYVVIARRHGSDWFVGAMTDARAEARRSRSGSSAARPSTPRSTPTRRDTATDADPAVRAPGAGCDGKNSRPLSSSLAAGGGARRSQLRPGGGALAEHREEPAADGYGRAKASRTTAPGQRAGQRSSQHPQRGGRGVGRRSGGLVASRRGRTHPARRRRLHGHGRRSPGCRPRASWPFPPWSAVTITVV